MNTKNNSWVAAHQLMNALFILDDNSPIWFLQQLMNIIGNIILGTYFPYLPIIYVNLYYIQNEYCNNCTFLINK